jgi:hypothetical protein
MSSTRKRSWSFKRLRMRSHTGAFPRALHNLIHRPSLDYLRRSKRALWSSMPSVSWPSGLSSPRSFSALSLQLCWPNPSTQIREVGGLTSEPALVLRQHRREAPGGHEIPHGVHSGPLQATAALSRVRHLIKDLAALTVA